MPLSLTPNEPSAILTIREKAGVSMIIGIGHDLSDITRIVKVLEGPTRKRFLSRVLSAGELALAEQYSGERLHQFTAGRFAAKEAVVKAFGCGIGKVMGFTDIEILRGSCGKPECSLSNAAWERLEMSPEAVRIHVTITHERKLASAFVVAERI
jgi:holo-[acyl-carrier protein] synthase